jgi:hypothetical protein
MLSIKKAGRVLIIAVFIICASFGIGIFGAGYRENFMNKRDTIELVEKKDDDDEDDVNDQIG